jgi:hypothetical protein
MGVQAGTAIHDSSFFSTPSPFLLAPSSYEIGNQKISNCVLFAIIDLHFTVFIA